MRFLLVFLAACTQMSEAADDQAASACTGLAESACLATPRCQSVHEEPGNTPPGLGTYVQCAPVDGAAALGLCSTLSEAGCVTRDDCIRWERPGPNDGPVFEKCVSE